MRLNRCAALVATWLLSVSLAPSVSRAKAFTSLEAAGVHDTHEAVVDFDASGGACNGTFIGPNTLLTAAHCVRAGFVIYAGRKSRTVVVDPAWPRSNDEPGVPLRAHDVALAIFAEDLAPAVLTIGSRAPEGSGFVEVVAIQGSLKRRMTMRALAAPLPGVRAVPASADSSPSSGLAPGDSGAPMLHEGRVVAVCSGIELRKSTGPIQVVFADVTTPSFASLLDQAIASGARL